jgi:hypothetical protein
MSTQSEHLGAFPKIGPVVYLDISEDSIREALESGPYPAETTWLHATYSDRLPLIARTGLIPSCWWGGDSCAIFGVRRRQDLGLVRRSDPLIEVRSRALHDSAKAWWVPPSAIKGVWRGTRRLRLTTGSPSGSPVWPREPNGCSCELREIVREQQLLWRETWA